MSYVVSVQWWTILIPMLVGSAVLLLVLAQRPPRGVAIGAWAFLAVCTALGLAQVVSEYRQAQHMAAVMKCVGKIPTPERFIACGSDKVGFVSEPPAASE